MWRIPTLIEVWRVCVGASFGSYLFCSQTTHLQGDPAAAQVEQASRALSGSARGRGGTAVLRALRRVVHKDAGGSCLFGAKAGGGRLVVFERERRHHHRHGGQSHGERGQLRREPDPKHGVERARRHGDPKHVVAQGEEEVQLDAAKGFAGYVKGGVHVHQTAADQHHICSLDGHVRTGPNRNPQVSLRNGWRVVDAVPNHGYYIPLLLKLDDFFGLVVWLHLRHHLLDTNLACDGVRGS
mmetsp:Transcript_5703/g.10881  ORF Transcript_5703/g.10881 Transcript_5703/m.10881 type:complete len:240 (+) Transcript_5703:410-1129(+)